HEAMEALNARIHTYDSNIDDLNNQILGLKARNNQLNVDVDRESEAMNQMAQMQSSYNSSLNRLAAIEKKMEKILGENASLKSELDTVKTSTEELKTSTAELKSSTEELAAVANTIPIVKQNLISEAPSTESESEEEIVEVSKDARAVVMDAIGSKISKATADEKDDLTLIKGVGRFIEEKLNGLGIYNYEQISQFDEEMIEKLTMAIEFFPGRIKRDDWVGQASRLMDIKADNPEALNPKAVFPDNSEDLKIVEGIGPKIEQLLKDAKINTWQELADTSVEALQAILKEAGDRFRIHDPSTWPMQAQMAADGEWDKLKDYQDFLQGGREKK
ncbi:MAG: helix-hairpin-helix domain-containing protein, partial [Saprospiraceae bacterium]|nr:helix-hairpin-helix domain-containing protein [Saprospiraceae bacterium]